LAAAAVEDLEALVRSHSLPADTHARVARSLDRVVVVTIQDGRSWSAATSKA